MLTNGYLKVAEVSALGQTETKTPHRILVCFLPKIGHYH